MNTNVENWKSLENRLALNIKRVKANLDELEKQKAAVDAQLQTIKNEPIKPIK